MLVTSSLLVYGSKSRSQITKYSQLKKTVLFVLISVIFSLLIKVCNSFAYICRILFVISFAFVHTGE